MLSHSQFMSVSTTSFVQMGHKFLLYVVSRIMHTGVTDGSSGEYATLAASQACLKP